MFANLQPPLNCSDDAHGVIVFGPLLVARRNAPGLFESVDQALHTVARAVDRAIKGASAMLVLLPWNRVPDMMTTQILPNLAATLACIRHQTARVQSGSSAPQPVDRALLH